jgi:hypothetical protein
MNVCLVAPILDVARKRRLLRASRVAHAAPRGRLARRSAPGALPRVACATPVRACARRSATLRALNCGSLQQSLSGNKSR